MAAYEVLLLNTAIPQIQAAQSGDTYVVPRDIAFSTVANLANGTNLLPSLTFSSDTNTGIYREGADALGFTAGGGTNQMVLTTTGLGIGASLPAAKLDVATTTPFTFDTTSTAGVKIGTQGTVGGSFMVQTQSASAPYGSGLAIDGTYSGATLQSTVNIKSFGVYSGGGYGSSLAFWTSSGTTLSQKMLLDSSGNLGLGVTPSTGDIYYRKFELGKVGCGLTAATTSLTSSELTYLTGNAYARYTGGNPWVYGNDGAAAIYGIEDGTHSWYNAPSGTANTTTITNGVSYTIITSGNQTAFGAANNNVGTVFTATSSGTLSSGTVSQNISFTQAMTLDALGNLGIGTTSPNSPAGSTQITLHISNGTAGTSPGIHLTNGDTGTNAGDGTLIFVGDAANKGTTSLNIYNQESSPICFFTATTEKARITSGGYFKASNAGTYAGSTGAYHELYSNASGDWIGYFTQAAASNPNGLVIQYTAAAPNGTGNTFLYCQDNTPAARAEIRSNGGLANYSANNVNLASDERLKKDVSPLDTTWDKLKQIKVVNFRYKDCNEGDPLLYGVIAQQVQPIVPELVVVTREAKQAVEAKDAVLDENGKVIEPAVEAKEATPEYYGIREQPMYWLAIKALQEAMARIEKLEAEVATLKGA